MLRATFTRTPKNHMDQDMLDCHMQVKYGVKSKENKQACSKCIQKVSTHQSHYHCSAATISDKMKKNCKEAWKKLKLDKWELEDEENDAAELTVKQKNVAFTVVCLPPGSVPNQIKHGHMYEMGQLPNIKVLHAKGKLELYMTSIYCVDKWC